MTFSVKPDSVVYNSQFNMKCGIFNARTYPEREAFVTSLFKKAVAPYYGDQTDELQKMWKSHSDRKVRILCKDEEPVGIVSFKTSITPDDQVGSTLKIKHLFIIHPEDKGKGYEEALIKYVKEVAEDMFGGLPDLSFTVSENEPEMLSAFKKEGFKVVETIKDFYKVGVPECFLKFKGSIEPKTDKKTVLAKPQGIRIALPGVDGEASPKSSQEGAKRKREEEPPSQEGMKRKRDEDRAYRPRNDQDLTFTVGRSPSRSLEVTLKQQYLAQIKNGSKPVEGRINNGMFKGIKPGTDIKFFNQTDSVLCEVKEVNRYSSFKEMLENEGLQACLPGCRNLEEGVRLYDAIPGYADKARQYGVVALRLLVKRS